MRAYYCRAIRCSGTFVNTLSLSLHPRGLLHSPIAMAVGGGSQFEINKDYSS
jgi:hypothetical protein